MALKVGINGFGRIGRMVLRSVIENNRKDLEIVAINNRGNNEVSSFLLKHDTVHGKLKTKISYTEKSIEINGKKIDMMHETEILNIDWKKYKVDVVKEKIKSINPFTKIKTYKKKITNKNLNNIIKNFDIMLMDQIILKQNFYLTNIQ